MKINTKQPFAFLLFCIVSAIALTFYIFQPHIIDRDYVIYFGEFVQSSNFSILAQDKLSSFSDRLNIGSYNLGFPAPPQKESIFGTNNGARVLPLLLFLSLLQKVLGPLWDRLYLFFVLLLPFVVFFKSARWNGASFGWASLGALLYGFNPWIFLRLSTGFWQLHLAYACLPFLLLYTTFDFKKSHIRDKARIQIFAILSASVVYLFQPHFLIILLFIVLVVLGTNPRQLRVFVGNVKFHLLTLFGIICILGFQIYPSLAYPPYRITLPNQYLNLASVRFNGASSSLRNVFRLENSGLSKETPDSDNAVVFLKYGFFIVGLIAIVNNIINKKQRRLAIAMLLSLLIFAFLSKGLNEPLSGFSEWLYHELVLLRPFRDPTRFYAGCILIISIAVSQIQMRKVLSEKLVLAIYIWFTLTFSIMVVDSAKSIDLIKDPYDYSKELLSNTSSSNRLSYFPQNALFSNYSWYRDGNSVGTQTSLFDSLVAAKVGLAQYSGYPDSYVSQLMLYGYSDLNKKDLYPLSVLSVDMVKIDGNLKDNNPSLLEIKHWNELLLSNPLANLVSSKNNITTYKIDHENIINDKPLIFVVGNIGTFSRVFQLLGDKYTIILLNQSYNIDSFTDQELSAASIIFENQGELNNVWLNKYREQFALPLAEKVWDYDQDWNLNEPYVSQEITKGVFFNSGRSIVSLKKNDTLSYSTNSIKSGKYRIVVSYFGVSSESPIRVAINGAVDDLPPNTSENRFEWYLSSPIQLSDAISHLDFKLTNTSGEKVIVDNVLLIPNEIFLFEKAKYEILIGSSNLVSLDKIENFLSEDETQKSSENGALKFSKISQTKYSVLSSSDWITARIPFDTYWKAGDSAPAFIGDYYGMVFANRDKSIDTTIYYTPETIYRAFLIISGISAIATILLLLRSYFR